MATIEPRLMHLLNGNDSRDHLPSIHSTLGTHSNDEDSDALLLPPLEFNTSEVNCTTPLKQQQQQQQQPALAATNASIYPSASEDDQNNNSSGSGWPARAIRLVSGDVGGADFNALPTSPDDPSLAGSASASIIGKRLRVLPHTDDLIQLPQPLKKQKSNQQVGPLSQVFPPIINGLHEPPPNAAVFPPIASEFDTKDTLGRGALAADFANGGGGGGSFGYEGLLTGVTATSAIEADKLSDSLLASGMPSSTTGSIPAAPSLPSCAPNSVEAVGDWGRGSSTSASASASKPKRRAAKPRRRWTEEETNQLLIGVSRHGLGKWTAILENPEFSFCNRSAGDLKDRFRTCCPDELRGKLSHPDRLATPNAPTVNSSTRSGLKLKTSLTLEDILIEQDAQYDFHGQPHHPDVMKSESSAATGSEPKLRKRRVHRRNMEDMVKLGIQGPFKKSHRRERRPFTDQDDREILKGLQIYGPAWTKIHRHPSFNLSSRQPTDLRDRVRNKYPETYASIEKGAFQLQPQEVGQGDLISSASGSGSGNDATNASAANTLLEPSVNTTMENTLPSRPSLPSLLRAEPLEPHDPSVFDISEPSSSAFLGSAGEMGISRLLLDDPQVPPYPL